MQVIGLCRFSYPAIGGFQLVHDTIEDRIAFLYDDARMEERFRLFEALTLPALRGQTDPDFDLVILIGDSLPQRHENRLRDLTADMRQVQIIKEPPKQHRPLVKSLLQNARRDPNLPCLQFRMDDDDAVAVDFVEELRRTSRDCKTLMRQNQAVAIDFNNGFLLRPSPDGPMVAEVKRPYLTAALAVHIAGGSKLTAMSMAHHVIYQHMPTITLTKRAMYVRSYNDFNDSHQRRGAPKEELSPITENQRSMLNACFNITDRGLADICKGL